MDNERRLIRKKCLKYLIFSGIHKQLINRIQIFTENIGKNLIEEHTIFEFPILVSIINLNNISGSLCDVLIRKPFFVQNIFDELILLMLNDYFQNTNKLQLTQIYSPIIIDPTQLLVPYNNPGLLNIEGVLFEKTTQKRRLLRSTWKCTSEVCRFTIIKMKHPSNPICAKCQSSMKELIQNRTYGEYIWLKINNNPTRISIKIDNAHFKNITFELGAEYLITAIQRGSFFEAWGCINIEKISFPLCPKSKLMQLKNQNRTNPWGFVNELASQFGEQIYPKQAFMNIKLGLLLSLASTMTKSPIPIIIISQDTNICNKLITDAIKYSERNITCTHLSNLNGDFTEYFQSAGALHLARNGVCYLNDWNLYKNKTKMTIASIMEMKRIQLNYNPTFDCVPLKCAIWAYVEKPFTKKENDQILTLFKIFGLVWNLNVLSEDADELITYLLSDENNLCKNLTFEEELKTYLKYVNSINVEISDEALNMLQQYFISVRRIRGTELPLTSLDPLQALTEAHARLNERSIAVTEDALIAIHLCEQNLEPTPLLPNPPKDILLFKIWVQQYIMVND